MNSLPNVLPASSYRTGCKSASGWIPNPLSIRARFALPNCIPSTIHFPTPPIPISFFPSFHLPRPASPENHPEAVHVGPAQQPEPARSRR